MPIMYDDRTPRDNRRPVGLAPSFAWQWLSWLAGMTGVLHAAWKLIGEEGPNSTLHPQGYARNDRRTGSSKPT